MTEYQGAIGIDLGTTRTCVGVMQNDMVEIIPNDQGNRTTPSYVAFTDTEILVGDSAKNQLALNAHNTVFDAKRLIGRNFSDPQIQQEMKHWPFKVIDREGRPFIQVEFKGKQETFSPEEISSIILTKMKEYAESYLGQTVKKAVITVPSYFNDSQRQATKEACTLAGLEVLRIINEPTAAAVAYGLNTEGERNIVILDLGGGTFDVSMLYIEDCVIEIKATAGDTHLGGEDFDNRMAEYFRHEFKRKYKKDLADNPTALRRLRTACERAKITLSTADKASVQIDSLMDNIDLSSPITREKFEQMNADLFSSCLEHVKKVLADSNLDKDQIHDVVLVGRSTRIPMIQEMLKDFFNGKELLKNINPDEVVAYGAAFQADVLTRPQDFFTPCTLYRSLCQEEIDDMVRKAEETMKEVKENSAKIDAKNRLESYSYHKRNAFDDLTVGGNLSAHDKGHLKTAVDDVIHWLDNHPDASKEEYERRQKDLESTVTPIISMIYQDGGMPDFFSSSSEQTSQLKFEELDID